MKARSTKVFAAALALALLAPCGLAAGKTAASSQTPSVENAMAGLAALDKDLDGVRGLVESSRGFAPELPSSIPEELTRARPRVREAVSHVFGLRWDRVEPVLAFAHEIEKEIADLEEDVRKWTPSSSGPVSPVTSPTASGAITGVVTDQATGDPLANVTVRVSGLTATSDSTGRWIVTGLGSGTYYASTSNTAGYLDEVYDDVPCLGPCGSYEATPIAVTDGAVTRGVDFALVKAGSISGTVTDATTGMGVSQLIVYLYSPYEEPPGRRRGRLRAPMAAIRSHR